jgi:hypothetical protein
MLILSWSSAAAGNYAYAFRLDVKRDVSVAPGGVLSLTSNLPLSIYCYVDYASGAPGLGLAKIFSSPPESPTDGLFTCRLTYVPAYLRSGLPTFRLTNVPAYLHVISCPTYLAFVHHQFKRNIYLSLLCDWNFLQNHFSFLSSKYAVEACDINNTFAADLVHCFAIVQASHVIGLHLCAADSVTPFPPMCVLF